MQWFEALQVFVKVGERKSFVQAARQLGLSTSRVTKLIQWLEQRLELILIVRTTRRVTLTEDGEYLLQRASLLLKEWDDLQNSLIDKNLRPQGTLQIVAPANLLNTVPVTNCMNTFLQKYQTIKINTQLISSPVNLSEQNIDILIGVDRYVLDVNHVIAKPIIKFKSVLCAAPEYLKKHPTINQPTDLRQHNCLLFRDESMWTFSNGKQYVEGNYASDTAIALFIAAIEGLGLIKAPDFMLKEWIDKKMLKPVLTDYETGLEYLNMYFQKRHYQSRKVTLFIEHATQFFKNMIK